MEKKKNFYRVLNVDRDASPSEIKKAYRKAAKKYHPDISAKNGEKFKQVQQAYETLGDPQKKTMYDRDLLSKDAPHPGPQEPFSRDDSPHRFFDRIDRNFFDFDNFWSDLMSDFTVRDEKRLRERFVEIILTPDEAREGGEISLDVPYWIPCSHCMGTGRRQGLICGRCRGEGEERSDESVTVVIPSGVSDGMRARIPVAPATTGGMDLIVTVRVRQVSIRVRH